MGRIFKLGCLGLVGVVVLIIIIAAVASSGGGSNGGGGGSKSTSSAASSGGSSKSTKPSKPKAKPKPSYTLAQQNAIEAAQNYLNIGSGFSRAGLIQQLTSKAGNGFKRSSAVFAVNHIKVDYNMQAVLSAKSYLNIGSGFSRSSLIQQLTSKAGSQFTLAQAKYAANHVGY